jgi:cytochrome c-type biogenesis protein CcmH
MPAAKTAFDAALAIDPGDARARYFIGLAKRQGGDAREAYDIWLALMKDLPPDASFLQDLRAHMASLSRELGIGTPTSALSDKFAAPVAGTAETGAGMPRDQMERIRGMVEGLARRLKDAPDDADGWRMLGKSYGVLGDNVGSVQAYARLVALRPDDPSAHRYYAEAVLKTVPSGEPYPSPLSQTLNWLYRSDPKDEFALFHLGESSSRAGNREMAVKYWHSLLEVLPKNASERAAVALRLRNLTETR